MTQSYMENSPSTEEQMIMDFCSHGGDRFGLSGNVLDWLNSNGLQRKRGDLLYETER